MFIQIAAVVNKPFILYSIQIIDHDFSLAPELLLCSTQLSMKFILLINVKMPTIVGILTFISRVNTSSESLRTRNTNLFSVLVFMNS